MSNHKLIRLKRFISSFTAKLCNWLFFKLHLMLHACVQKFDVKENLRNFWKLNMALLGHAFVKVMIWRVRLMCVKHATHWSGKQRRRYRTTKASDTSGQNELPIKKKRLATEMSLHHAWYISFLISSPRYSYKFSEGFRLCLVHEIFLSLDTVALLLLFGN